MFEHTPQTITVIIKRYAAGKAFACATGDRAFSATAGDALARSLVMDIRVDRERFVAFMRERGVPEQVIEDYVESMRITDEAWLQDVLPA